MESYSPTSWQTSLSAEYNNYIATSPSPPGSPVASPSSPTLYNSPLYDGTIVHDEFKEDFVSSRSQLATNLLNNLEQYGNEQFQNELGIWNNEDLNLDLFDELSELEYVAPPTPASQEFQNQDQLAEYDVDIADEQEVESIDQLSVAFQAIIDSLPRTAHVSGDELIDLTELPELIFSSSSTPFLVGDTVQYANQIDGGECIATLQESSTDESENEEDYFMETDVAAASAELGSTYQYLSMDESNSMLSCTSTSTTDEEDNESQLSDEKMLDALLAGDLTKAAIFLPGVIRVTKTSISMPEPAKNKRKSNPAKSARSTNVKKNKPKKPRVERVIRKKEQNKFAASRYRNKKKLETEVTIGLEQELQEEHDVWMEKKVKLVQEVSFVKGLLRDLFEARKKNGKK